MNRRWAGVAMGAVVVSVLTACGGSDGPSTLTYRVEGSATEAVVRYVDADGTTSEEATVPLPFSIDLEVDGTWIGFNAVQDDTAGLFAISSDGARTVSLARFSDTRAEWPSWYPSMAPAAEPVTISFAR